MAKVKNFFLSIGRWFKNHLPTRRRIIQVYAALLTNANLKGYAEGQIYTGNTKVICTPGLNCYSCPGAVAACPLGSLQNSLGSSNTTTPYYILGILALFGLLLARTICGFLCPFGFFQELLYKVKTPKVKKSAYTRVLSYLKYLLLIVLVIAVPLIYKNVPGFCKYICPAGTFGGAGGLIMNSANADLYGMLGYLFSWKFALLIVCIIACIFIYRAFCRFICPLGAIYGFFNKISLLGVKLDKSRCIECGMCISKCKMDIKHVGDHECINCGECIAVCPTKAISWKGSKIFLKPTSVAVSAANGAPEGGELKPLNVYIENGTTLNAKAGAVERAESAPAGEQKDSGGEPLETGTDSVPVERDVEPQTVPEKPEVRENRFKAALKKFNNRAVILETVAWILAVAVLVTALVYFNTRPSMAQAQIDNFTCGTYNDSEEEFELEDNGGLPTIIAFWSMRNETSMNYIPEFMSMYEEFSGAANFLIVHISTADTDDAVKATVDSKGWNTSEIPLIHDTSEIDLYNKCGGDGSLPMTAFLSGHCEMYSHHSGPLTSEKIKEELGNGVYQVGDKLPEIEFKAYESAFKEKTYNTKQALGKVLVINFWYVSCGPCVEELPYFNEVQKEYAAKGEEVVMLAIHSVNTDKPQWFIDNDESITHSPGKVVWKDWDIIFGQDTKVGERDKLYSMLGGRGPYPMTIVVDAEGYIVATVHGPIINIKDGKDELRPAIEKAFGR